MSTSAGPAGLGNGNRRYLSMWSQPHVIADRILLLRPLPKFGQQPSPEDAKDGIDDTHEQMLRKIGKDREEIEAAVKSRWDTAISYMQCSGESRGLLPGPLIMRDEDHVYRFVMICEFVYRCIGAELGHDDKEMLGWESEY
ncbi:Uu.00g096430.m01.CDS01 [Anthostomella pinea]|uniref:Uu.00g096430.m01.CDS01 n=1 Tax=Anthostomella pinea TaxID=933095 RepID=A0AAI8VC82_9PEZI|nr:Uu.00g096430.m01.CDS01 [Anthostomella pinea]